jgi:hypothetical protein
VAAKGPKQPETYQVAETKKRIQDLEDSTLFRLISTNVDNDSRLKDYSCVKIQHVKSGLYLTQRKLSYFVVDKKVASGGDEGDLGKLYQPLDDEDINNASRVVIELKEEAGYEDAFFIQNLD